MRGSRVLTAAVLVLSGCAPTASFCEVPDEVCPAEAPHAGSGCVGAMSCFYPHPDFEADPMGLRLTCVDRVWREEILCEGCPPRTYERCRAPSTTPVPGALLTITLADEPMVFGPQGAAMVAHTLTIDGLEEQRCMTVRERTFLDGMPAPAELNVVFRCGSSRLVQALLYDLPCAPGLHHIELSVEVVGVPGTATASFDYDGSRCPPLSG